ncbi:MAG: glycerophosphodiester phosphodiesterase family protein [Ferruginibacter sp.]
MATGNNILHKLPSFDKQGHRGCRGLAPENTIPAMLRALDLGVTTLEMDVVFTKDSIAILSHEPFFNHEITTRGNGTFIEEKDEKNYNIFKMTFAETRQYDVGLKPHPRFPQQQKMAAHKPSLAEMFDSVKQSMMTRRRPFPYFNIETKTTPFTDNIYHPAPGPFVDMLMKVIKEKGMEQWVTIQSFDIRTLQYLHKNYPLIPAVLLIEDYDKRSLEEQLKELGFIPAVYSPHYSLVNDALISKCREQQIKVIPWTVNDKNTINKLIAMGVDGIITDYPNLFNE